MSEHSAGFHERRIDSATSMPNDSTFTSVQMDQIGTPRARGGRPRWYERTGPVAEGAGQGAGVAADPNKARVHFCSQIRNQLLSHKQLHICQRFF